MSSFKSILVFILGIVLICLFSWPVYSQYTPVVVTISTAQAAIGGTAVSNLSISIHNRLTDAPESKITWTNLIWGTTAWKVANQYTDVAFSCSVNKWYIVVKTDNTDPAIADPLYKGSDDTAAGLVNTFNSNQTLELVWHIQNDTTGSPVIDPPQAGAFTNANWFWKWILDDDASAFDDITSNTNMTEGPTSSSLPINYYAIPMCKGVNQGVINPTGADDGRLWGAGAWERGDAINSGSKYLYWAANFATADMTVYRTSTIKCELVVE